MLIVRNQGTELMQMRHSMDKMEVTIAKLESTNQEVLRCLQALQKPSSSQEPAVSCAVEGASTTNALANEEEQHGVVSPWPTKVRQTERYDALVINKYKGPIPCQTLFKLWFQDQLPVAFENIPQGPTKRKLKNGFSETKTVVHVMLKNLKKYPTPEDDLDVIANTAMQNIMQNHQLAKAPSRSRIATSSRKGDAPSLFIGGEYGRMDFPLDTPEAIKVYFQERSNNKK